MFHFHIPGYMLNKLIFLYLNASEQEVFYSYMVLENRIDNYYNVSAVYCKIFMSFKIVFTRKAFVIFTATLSNIFNA